MTTWLAHLRYLTRQFSPLGMREGRLLSATGIDVLVTHDEVNGRHGTGVLLGRLFGSGASMISARTVDNFDGEQSFGVARVRLPEIGLPRALIARFVRQWFAGIPVRRVVCVPFYPDELFTAMAVQELFKVPLCLYFMDDHNVYDRVISDRIMREALSKAVLRLAISPEMQSVYQNKYGCKFWLLPPLVDRKLICTKSLNSESIFGNKGILVGNIWFQDWLNELLKTVKGAGVEIDWYCNSPAPRGLKFQAAALAGDGIRFHPPLSEEALATTLPGYAFAIIPSGTRAQSDAASAIANLSLPSRLAFIVAAAHIPVIVAGGEAGAAARFVERFEVGLRCDYNLEDFRRAVAHVLDPAIRAKMRRNAGRLAPYFSDADATEWFWKALEKSEPPDLRYEALFSLNS